MYKSEKRKKEEFEDSESTMWRIYCSLILIILMFIMTYIAQEISIVPTSGSFSKITKDI